MVLTFKKDLKEVCLVKECTRFSTRVIVLMPLYCSYWICGLDNHMTLRGRAAQSALWIKRSDLNPLSLVSRQGPAAVESRLLGCWTFIKELPALPAGAMTCIVQGPWHVTPMQSRWPSLPPTPPPFISAGQSHGPLSLQMDRWLSDKRPWKLSSKSQTNTFTTNHITIRQFSALTQSLQKHLWQWPRQFAKCYVPQSVLYHRSSLVKFAWICDVGL